jgi:hypothetical protein
MVTVLSAVLSAIWAAIFGMERTERGPERSLEDVGNNGDKGLKTQNFPRATTPPISQEFPKSNTLPLTGQLAGPAHHFILSC